MRTNYLHDNIYFIFDEDKHIDCANGGGQIWRKGNVRQLNLFIGAEAEYPINIVELMKVGRVVKLNQIQVGFVENGKKEDPLSGLPPLTTPFDIPPCNHNFGPFGMTLHNCLHCGAYINSDGIIMDRMYYHSLVNKETKPTFATELPEKSKYSYHESIQTEILKAHEQDRSTDYVIYSYLADLMNSVDQLIDYLKEREGKRK